MYDQEKEELKNFIISGDYKEVQKIIDNIDDHVAGEMILKIAFETENVMTYTFVCFLLLKAETAFWRSVAAQVLSQPLCFIEGAYLAGLMHLRRAIQLDNNNISFKEYLLFFYDLPEPLLDAHEPIEVAQEIIKYNPTSKVALHILEHNKRQ